MGPVPRVAYMLMDQAEDPGGKPGEPAEPGKPAEQLGGRGFLRRYRQTLELTCPGLDAAALASRPVEPSALSLLGIVKRAVRFPPVLVGRVALG
jgi:hypothetical protein